MTTRRNPYDQPSLFAALDQAPSPALSDPTTKVARGARRTSRAAAAKAGDSAGGRRTVLLRMFAAKGPEGYTDQELGRLTRWDGNTVRPRRGELVEAGWVAATEERRATSSGLLATVWAITPAGTEQAALLEPKAG